MRKFIAIGLVWSLVFGNPALAQQGGGTGAAPDPVPAVSTEAEVEGPGSLGPTFASIAAAFMAWSLKGCLKPSWNRVPLYTLVTAASVFLFNEMRSQDDFKNQSSMSLLQYQGADNAAAADQQVKGLRAAAMQSELAARAAEDKAKNARLFKRMLKLSGTLYGAFALAYCTKNAGATAGFGIGACLAKYSSCKKIEDTKMATQDPNNAELLKQCPGPNCPEPEGYKFVEDANGKRFERIPLGEEGSTIQGSPAPGSTTFVDPENIQCPEGANCGAPAPPSAGGGTPESTTFVDPENIQCPEGANCGVPAPPSVGGGTSESTTFVDPENIQCPEGANCGSPAPPSVGGGQISPVSDEPVPPRGTSNPPRTPASDAVAAPEAGGTDTQEAISGGIDGNGEEIWECPSGYAETTNSNGIKICQRTSAAGDGAPGGEEAARNSGGDTAPPPARVRSTGSSLNGGTDTQEAISGGIDGNGEEIWECPSGFVVATNSNGIKICQNQRTPAPPPLPAGGSSQAGVAGGGDPAPPPSASSTPQLNLNCPPPSFPDSRTGVCIRSSNLQSEERRMETKNWLDREMQKALEAGDTDKARKIEDYIIRIYPSQSYLPWKDLFEAIVPTAHADSPYANSRRATGAVAGMMMSTIPSFRKIGITTSAVSILSKIQPLQKSIVKTPDIAKGAILGGLAVIVGKSEKKWTQAAETLQVRADKYNALADELEKQTLAGTTSIQCDPGQGSDCQQGSGGGAGGFGSGGGFGGEGSGEDIAGGGGAEGSDPRSREDTKKRRGQSSITRSGGPQQATPTSCSVGPQGSQSIDRDCACKKTNSCTRTGLPRFNNFSSANLPSFATESYNDMARGSDSLYNGGSFDEGGAAFANLNRNAARMDRLNKAVFSQLKDAVDQYEGAGTFDQYADGAMKGFNRAVLSSYGSFSPGAQSGLMGSIGGGGLGFGSGFDDNFDSGFADGFASEGVRLEGGGGMGSMGGMGMPSFGDAGDFGPMELGDQSIASANVEVPMAALGKYQSSENDISARPSVSIWKVISSRYIKSAVPVLLKKKP